MTLLPLLRPRPSSCLSFKKCKWACFIAASRPTARRKPWIARHLFTSFDRQLRRAGKVRDARRGVGDNREKRRASYEESRRSTDRTARSAEYVISGRAAMTAVPSCKGLIEASPPICPAGNASGGVQVHFWNPRALIRLNLQQPPRIPRLKCVRYPNDSP